MQPEAPQGRGVAEVFRAFLVQGLTAFGGPVAHLGYFRRAFVERRGWLTEAEFADLMALCQFLPGPASSQLGMAIGLQRAGLPGALAAWAGFTLPAALLMIGFAYAAPALTEAWGGGWLHGLKIVAAAVVAQAVVAMARNLARGPIRAGIAIGAAAGLILAHGPVAQVFALLAAGAFGLAWLQEPGPAAASTAPEPIHSRSGAGWLTAFAALLFGMPVAAHALGSPTLDLVSVFYRAGSLVFGGGHVVLPLLEGEIVGRGWMTRDAFLAGYGAAQAVPGPLFSFAGYVGAVQHHAVDGWRGGLVALVAIFLPSLLLMLGVLPAWSRLKARPSARGALAGINAAVVGLLAAALWDPVLTGAVERLGDVALVGAAFLLLTLVRAPPWAVALAFAAAVGMVAP